MNEVILSFSNILIREFGGNVIINSDFKSDLIRLIT